MKYRVSSFNLFETLKKRKTDIPRKFSEEAVYNLPIGKLAILPCGLIGLRMVLSLIAGTGTSTTTTGRSEWL